MNRTILLAAALCACGSAAAAEPAKDCAAIADAATRLACYDEKHGAAAPAAAAPAAAEGAPPAATPAAAADGFGLPPKPEPVESVKSIKAHIVGPVTSWERGTRFKLDNGQVWKVVGDESRYYQGIPENPEIVIERSMFGSFWLEIVAVRAKIKVKRVS